MRRALDNCWQLRKALYSFSKDTENAEGAAKALRQLEKHVANLGRRGAGWKTVLPIESLDKAISADDKTSPLWRGDFFTALEFIEAEARVSDRGRFDELRPALTDKKAQIADPFTDTLAQSVRQAKSRYRPATEQQLEQARQRLRNSMIRLDSFLSRGSRANAEKWKKFLNWEDLQAIRDPSSAPRLSKLAKVFGKLQSGENGLNLPVFRQVSTDLERYLEFLNSYDSRSQRLADAKQELQDALDQLGGFLKSGPAHRDTAWRKYLRWEELSRLINDDSRDVRAMASVLRQYESDQAGLEYQQFRRVSRRLAKYTELIALQQRAPAVDQFDARLEKLARDLNTHFQEATTSSLAALTEHLEWLETVDQLPDLRQRLMARFAAPNLGVRVSSDLVRRALSNSSSQVTPVGMCFFGAWVSGSSRSNVNYQARLVPSNDRVVMEIEVVGASRSNTVGRQRRVSVYTQGDTSLHATKQLVWDGNRITTTPASASASTQQQFCGVHVDRLIGTRLIGRFARRRTFKLQPCAEQVADSQARSMLSKQMDTQTIDMLATANQRLAELEGRLRTRKLYPDALHVNSTTQAMFINAKLLSSRALAAPSTPPAVPGSSDVLVQVHESLINNMLAERVRGVRIDSDTIAIRMKEMGLPVPPELTGKKKATTITEPVKLNAPANVESDTIRLNDNTQTNGVQDKSSDDDESDEPWSMQFDRTQPVAIEFRDGKIKVTVRGFNFTRGDQTIDETIELTATYRFVFSQRHGLHVKREGEVAINFVGAAERLSTRQITYKTFLRAACRQPVPRRVFLG